MRNIVTKLSDEFIFERKCEKYEQKYIFFKINKTVGCT